MRGLLAQIEADYDEFNRLWEGFKSGPIDMFKEDKFEYAFFHTSNYGETYLSFVNGQHTTDGGSHQSAFREGLLDALIETPGYPTTLTSLIVFPSTTMSTGLVGGAPFPLIRVAPRMIK